MAQLSRAVHASEGPCTPLLEHAVQKPGELLTDVAAMFLVAVTVLLFRATKNWVRQQKFWLNQQGKTAAIAKSKRRQMLG